MSAETEDAYLVEPVMDAVIRVADVKHVVAALAAADPAWEVTGLVDRATRAAVRAQLAELAKAQDLADLERAQALIHGVLERRGKDLTLPTVSLLTQAANDARIGAQYMVAS